MSTEAEQEAERRYPLTGQFETVIGNAFSKLAFEAGWNECESRHRELLEAAREYRNAKEPWLKQVALDRLREAAAALDES